MQFQVSGFISESTGFFFVYITISIIGQSMLNVAEEKRLHRLSGWVRMGFIDANDMAITFGGEWAEVSLEYLSSTADPPYDFLW